MSEQAVVVVFTAIGRPATDTAPLPQPQQQFAPPQYQPQPQYAPPPPPPPMAAPASAPAAAAAPAAPAAAPDAASANGGAASAGGGKEVEVLPAAAALAPRSRFLDTFHWNGVLSAVPLLTPHSELEALCAAERQLCQSLGGGLPKFPFAQVLSPMSGTMYRSPAPGEPPFVKEGDRVTKGQTIAIIEAMKLMNEIEVHACNSTQDSLRACLAPCLCV